MLCVWVWWHSHLISASERQRQVEGLEAGLVYRVSYRSAGSIVSPTSIWKLSKHKVSYTITAFLVPLSQFLTYLGLPASLAILCCLCYSTRAIGVVFSFLHGFWVLGLPSLDGSTANAFTCCTISSALMYSFPHWRFCSFVLWGSLLCFCCCGINFPF